MRRRLIWMLLLTAPLIIVMSCGDDDDPPSGVSFELVSEDITESDGTLASFQSSSGGGIEKKIKIIFDRPMAENAVISYAVTGTANKKDVTDSNGNTNGYDYYIDGINAKDTETLIINKGDTEAYINLTIFEDYEFEVDDLDAAGNFIETVVFTLSSVVSGPASLGTENLTYTLNIKEDDAVFFLDWTVDNTTTKGDVDLDFVVQTGGQVANLSVSRGASYEALYIPAGFPAGTYNINYPYYSGTSDNVKVGVYMYNTAGTLNGNSYPYSSINTSDGLFSSATYTKKNVHAWNVDVNNILQAEINTLLTVQTMVKSGINYTNISSITVPANSSRISSNTPSIEAFKLNNDQLKRFMSNKFELRRK